MGGVGEMSESILPVQPRTKPLIYGSDRRAAWRSGIEIRCQFQTGQR